MLTKEDSRTRITSKKLLWSAIFEFYPFKFKINPDFKEALE